MPKKVSGILIDFPAAKDIYVRAVPSELNIISNLRGNDLLFFASEEEDLYSQDPVATQVFGNQQPDFITWNDDALIHCDKIAQQVPEHRFLGQDRLPLCLAALAKTYGFGVLSGTKHPSHFISPSECCALVGVYCWSVAVFYAEYGKIKFV